MDALETRALKTLVYENQQAYYDVLGHADNQGESTEFVEFMLGMIRDALQEISKAQNEHDVVINVAKKCRNKYYVASI